MKNLLILITAVFATVMTTQESKASILCHTPRSNKIFEIEGSKITFFNEFDTAAKREIASVFSRHKNSSKGFTKIVDFENQKHTIHISDSKNFSDSEDYIIVKVKSGHEVTYPLTCELK